MTAPSSSGAAGKSRKRGRWLRRTPPVLSLLVFPGLGQMVLKRPVRGLAQMVLGVAIILAPVGYVLTGGDPADLPVLMTAMMAAFFGLGLLSAFDAYVLGLDKHR